MSQLGHEPTHAPQHKERPVRSAICFRSRCDSFLARAFPPFCRLFNKDCTANHIGGALLSFRASRHCRSRSPLSMVIDQMAAGSHGRGSDLLARQALGARRI
jgi:hypothetical protein